MGTIKTIEEIGNEIAEQWSYSSFNEALDIEYNKPFYIEVIKAHALQVAKAACERQRAICMDAYLNCESEDIEDFIYNANPPLQFIDEINK